MHHSRRLVLIVDDEDNIVLALHRVLYQDNERYDVLLAKSGEVAQVILRERRIDVMVTDVHLPGICGIDLLCWAAIESPNTRVIVMTAFDITGIKDRAHAFGCLRLVRKPFDVHEMRAAVCGALDHGDGFAGRLSDLSLVDVIQMLCISRKTTALRVSHGASSGIILLENGEVVHAVWEDTVGDEAFFRLLSLSNGAFYTFPPPPEVERTIHESWQHLLMEGMRRLDEGAREQARTERPRRPSEHGPDPAVAAGTAPAPASASASAQAAVPAPASTSAQAAGTSPRSVATPAPTPKLAPASVLPPVPPPPRLLVPTDVDKLVDQGFAALKAGDHVETLRLWEQGLRADPSNRMLELNLRKLQAKMTDK